MKDKIYEVAILGAGAAGLCAACELSSKGLSVALVEKNHKIGRKILSTGAGKCNISNRFITPEDYLCDEKEKLAAIFKNTAPKEVFEFLSSKLGILLSQREEGRLFPYSMKAETVVFAFERFLKSCETEVFLLSKAVSAKKIKEFFEIELREQLFGEEKKKQLGKTEIIRARKLIMACGGPSYPRIGGCEDGFSLAQAFGHSVSPLRPLLTSFSVKTPNLSSLEGVRVKALLSLPQEKAKVEGEILFTSYGISGDAAIDLSFLRAKQLPSRIFLDLMPEKDEKEIFNFFSKLNGSIYEILSCSLEKKLVNFILSSLRIDKENKSESALKAAIGKIKNFELSSLSPMGFDYAMAKIGGVPLSEIDENFRSLKEKDLFLIGETLDCGGRSGGYNLHFAFTGGISCAKAFRP